MPRDNLMVEMEIKLQLCTKKRDLIVRESTALLCRGRYTCTHLLCWSRDHPSADLPFIPARPRYHSVCAHVGACV